MSLGINCLIKNTQLHQIVKDAVNTLGDMYVAAGSIPTVKDIWKELRANGIEVDVSTVGYIYSTELSTKSNEFYQVDEVEEQSSSAFAKAINKIMNRQGTLLTIGEESPVEMVANSLSKLYNSLFQVQNIKSVQRDLQDVLLKGMKRMLPSNSTVQKSQNFDEVVNEALVNKSKGILDINGNLNSLKEMHSELKKELERYVKEIEKSDSFEAAKFRDYVNEIMNSSYQLMLSKTEASDVVIDALKSFDERFVKEVNATDKNGNKIKREIPNWNQITKQVKSVTDIENMVEAVFKSKTDAAGNRIYSDEDVDIIKTSLSKEFQTVFQKNIVERASNVLNNKLKEKPSKNQREQFERLAELQSLGAFNDQKFNPLIYKALGVSELPIESMRQIEAVTETINKLLDNVKNPMQANLLFRQLTSDINLIVQKNITTSDNKLANVALKTIRHFNLYTQAALNGILMNMFNMVQNVTANTMQMISSSVNLMTKGDWRYLNKNVKLFWSTLIDTGFRNGLVDGLQAGEFANEARLDDYLRKSFKELFTNKSVGDKFLGIWKAVLTPFRVLGSAYDAAAKSVNTKKLFTLALNDVLAAKGLKSEARFKVISDALYDGKLLDESIEEANKLIELIGDKPNKDRAYRMAQNIMAYKLVDSGTISETEFNSIVKTAFKVAGKGLGHEYQYELKDTDGLNLAVQGFSLVGRGADLLNTSTQYWKNTQMADNKKLGFAIASLVDNVKTTIFTKFIGGATRWIPLTAQSGGFGAFAVSQLGKKIELLNTNGEVKNENDLKANLEKKLTKNEAFFRGITGVAYTYTLGLIIKSMLDTECKEGDEECIKNKNSAKNYIKETIARKTDPHRNLMKLALDAFDGDGQVFDKDSYKFITQTFNIDNKFSPYEQFKGISQNLGITPMDNPNQKPDFQQAMGNLGRMLSGSYTNPINSYFKAAKIMTQGKPKFQQSTTLNYGLFGDGLLENLGALKSLGIRNDGVTGLKGIGGGKVEHLQSLYNISTKSDLKKYLDENGSFDELKYPIHKKDGTTIMRKVFSEKESADVTDELNNMK